MGERTLGRREVLMGAGVAAGGVALTGLGAAPAEAKVRHGDNRGLSGSWLATRQDDGAPTSVKLVLSFAAGGVVISHDINPADVPFTGTWTERHGGKFKVTMWSGFSGGPTGGAGPTARVRIRGSRAHNQISGTYDFTVFDPVTDEVITSGTGTFTGSRIEA